MRDGATCDVRVFCNVCLVSGMESEVVALWSVIREAFPFGRCRGESPSLASLFFSQTADNRESKNVENSERKERGSVIIDRVPPIKMYRWNEHDRIIARYTCCNSRGRRIAIRGQ